MGKPFTYGSVCSGIEAATAAWHPLGWKPAFFSEIEPFPRAVLAHHYPSVPLHGDFTTIQDNDYEPIDLLVGGTPCQSFSVAGLRGGLSDDRGNLALEFLRLAQRLRPRWLVWENVPGVLSSGGGRDFGSILGGLVELGYGFAYRVLDAQYFGVPQRRRRVFVVAYLGDAAPARAVLFERHSLQGNPAPRRGQGQEVTGTFTSRAKSGGWGTDVDLASSGYMRPVTPPDVLCVATGQAGAEVIEGISPSLTCNHESPYVVAPPLTSNPYGDHESREGLLVPVIAHTLTSSPSTGRSPTEDANLIPITGEPIPFDLAQITSSVNRMREEPGLPASTLAEGSNMHVAVPTYIAAHETGQGFWQEGDVSGTLRAEGENRPSRPSNIIAFGAQNSSSQSMNPSEIVPTLDKSKICAVAIPVGINGNEIGFALRANPSASGDKGDGGINTTMVAYAIKHDKEPKISTNRTGTLQASNGGSGIISVAAPMDRTFDANLFEPKQTVSGMQVRRLTPVECERLQGFADGFTEVPYRGKPASQCPDGPRYKALGNSMAVDVMQWIGERIQMVEDFLQIGGTK